MFAAILEAFRRGTLILRSSKLASELKRLSPPSKINIPQNQFHTHTQLINQTLNSIILISIQQNIFMFAAGQRVQHFKATQLGNAQRTSPPTGATGSAALGSLRAA